MGDVTRSKSGVVNERLNPELNIHPTHCQTTGTPSSPPLSPSPEHINNERKQRQKTGQEMANRLRKGLEPQNLTTIERLREGATKGNIGHVLKEGLVRLERLFNPKTSPEKRRESETAIDFYLENNTFLQPVPSVVRDLLVEFDMVIRDVHHAFPYGRGNLLVRNREALVENAGHEPDEFNVTESALKNGLSELGKELGYVYHSSAALPALDDVQYGLRQAASQMLLGSTTCSGYVDAMAGAFMVRLRSISLPDGCTLRLKVVGHVDGQIQLDNVSLDHVICEANYTEKNGNAFSIILDPWADMNTPILKEHSRYQYGAKALEYAFDDPNLPYQETMEKYMRGASGYLQKTLDDKDLELQVTLDDISIESAAPNKNYPLTQPHKGFFTRESLSAVTEGTNLPEREESGLVTRRASIYSSQMNAIFSNSD